MASLVPIQDRSDRRGLRATPVAILLLLLPLLSLLPLLGTGCGGGDGGTPLTPEKTAEELTQSGWASFEVGNFDAALQDFTQAIGKDNTYGPAYVGQGWTRLGRAVTAEDLSGALTSFDNAISRQQSGAEVRAGRAAVLLALGGSNLGAAIADAQTARAASPSFVFSHRTTFNAEDLLLIEAFAQAEQGAYAAALAAANTIAPSNILEANPATWLVSGTPYPTFHNAVLAYLSKLSTERAG